MTHFPWFEVTVALALAFAALATALLRVSEWRSRRAPKEFFVYGPAVYEPAPGTVRIIEIDFTGGGGGGGATSRSR